MWWQIDKAERCLNCSQQNIGKLHSIYIDCCERSIRINRIDLQFLVRERMHGIFRLNSLNANYCPPFPLSHSLTNSHRNSWNECNAKPTFIRIHKLLVGNRYICMYFGLQQTEESKKKNIRVITKHNVQIIHIDSYMYIVRIACRYGLTLQSQYNVWLSNLKCARISVAIFEHIRSKKIAYFAINGL